MLKVGTRQRELQIATRPLRENYNESIASVVSSSKTSSSCLLRTCTRRFEGNARHRGFTFLIAISFFISSGVSNYRCQAFCPPRGPQKQLRAAPRSSLSGSSTRRSALTRMTWDFLSPARYAIEKSVASRSIPDVSHIQNRVRLQDCFENDRGERFDHSLWTAVLKRHVSPGVTFGKVENVNAVNYASIGTDDDFWAYLKSLEEAQPDQLSKSEQLAFWMNAYNALCIATIVHHETTAGRPMLDSITKLSSPDKGPIWDQVVPNCKIEGRDITLNTIEHVKLRAVWAEPAVHACIVCASASCPNLRPEAFVADQLVHQMNDQMRDWMSNPTKGFKLAVASSASSRGNRLELSRIFLWFAEDFGGIRGLKEWLPQFTDDPQVSDEALASATVRYFEYDWQMNRAPAPAPVAQAAAAASATRS